MLYIFMAIATGHVSDKIILYKTGERWGDKKARPLIKT